MQQATDQQCAPRSYVRTPVQFVKQLDAPLAIWPTESSTGAIVPTETLYLYEFRYRCPLRKRWVTAGYRAELHEIADCYAEWETIGEPEVRVSDPD